MRVEDGYLQAKARATSPSCLRALGSGSVWALLFAAELSVKKCRAMVACKPDRPHGLELARGWSALQPSVIACLALDLTAGHAVCATISNINAFCVLFFLSRPAVRYQQT